jgi:hypothetical protein
MHKMQFIKNQMAFGMPLSLRRQAFQDSRKRLTLLSKLCLIRQPVIRHSIDIHGQSYIAAVADQIRCSANLKKSLDHVKTLNSVFGLGVTGNS